MTVTHSVFSDVIRPLDQTCISSWIKITPYMYFLAMAAQLALIVKCLVLTNHFKPLFEATP